MNVVDTSAIVAVLFNEPGGEEIKHKLMNTSCVMSAATRVELGVITETRKGAGKSKRLRQHPHPHKSTSTLPTLILNTVDFSSRIRMDKGAGGCGGDDRCRRTGIVRSRSY